MPETKDRLAAAVPGAPGNALGGDATAIIAELRRLFLDRLTLIVTGAGAGNAPSQIAMRQGAGQFFDDVALQRTRAGFEQARGLTASKITLVNDSQLELGIRLGEVSRRLTDACAMSLSKLFPRFVTLLDRPDLEGDENPVGPEAVCAGLGEFFAALDLRHDQALAQLAEIESALLRELPLLYAEINQLLASRQIHAARRPSRADGRHAGQATSGSGGPDPLAVLQRALLGRLPQGAAMPAGSGAVPAGGLATMAAGTMMLGDAPSGAAAVFDGALLQQLLSMLQDRPSQAEPDLFGGSGTESADDGPASTAELRALRAGEFGRLARGQDAASLDALALLFEAIFDDERLPDAVKAAMARLQIPLLKAAMLDASFFADRSHPARGLMDTMARAAAGLAPNTDGEHPVCVELRRVATSVRTEFDRDPDVFARYAAELETFIARRHQDLQGAAQKYIVLGQTQEARDLADLEARQALRDLTLAQAPPVIANFLRTHWRSALAAAYLEGGETGTAWADARAVIDDLLWSLQPKPDPEERKRLATMVPGLLQRLRRGLDRAGISAEARAPFLDACFVLQAAALRGKPAELAQASSPHADGEATPTDHLTELAQDDLKLLVLRQGKTATAADNEPVPDLACGDWIEFELSPDDRRRGRLTWISPLLGNPLFTNPAWDYAISLARSILERQLATGQASIVGGESIFDSAAEKALKAMAGPLQDSRR